jgi:hypothetical protein
MYENLIQIKSFFFFFFPCGISETAYCKLQSLLDPSFFLRNVFQIFLSCY